VERLLEPLAAVFGAQQAVDGALVQRHLRHHA
jgi:DNA-binding FrmR family transcriptional regulator